TCNRNGLGGKFHRWSAWCSCGASSRGGLPGRRSPTERRSCMAERLMLPVLPLRETVVFPGTTIPISAGRPGTVEAIQAALETKDRLMFAVCQRENVDEAEPEVLYGTGVVVRIVQVQRARGGLQL